MPAYSISPESDHRLAGEGHTLLIVDDDPNLQAMLRWSLQREGYRVLCANDGRQAIDRVRRLRPSAVILDVMMPELDGLWTCRALRAFSDVPIIFTSAKNTERDVIEGLEVGGDDYVCKPYSLAELKARLISVIRRDTANRQSAPLFDDGKLRVDLMPACVRRNGQVVRLRPKDRMLLIELVIRRGTVVSHEELLALVWGSDHVTQRGVLTPAISRLRQKLEDTPGEPQYIHTRFRLGYYFEPSVGRSLEESDGE